MNSSPIRTPSTIINHDHHKEYSNGKLKVVGSSKLGLKPLKVKETLNVVER